MNKLRHQLQNISKKYPIYKARRDDFRVNDNDVPFLISPDAYVLSSREAKELEEMGKILVDYFDAIFELYNTNHYVKMVLDFGKPKVFTQIRKSEYLFIRPDIVVTDKGFCICEIETSPFGLALADMLNSVYSHNIRTIVEPGLLKNTAQELLGPTGNIAYTDKTSQYSGQLDYLAHEIFSSDSKTWKAENIDHKTINESKAVYRGFYLNEYEHNKAVKRLIDNTDISFLPSLTPQFEEKAIMSFIWQDELKKPISTMLSADTLTKLRKWIPRTKIVNNEFNKSPENFAQVGKSSRRFVLKVSGYSENSSWSEDVHFLHKLSREKVEHLESQAQLNKDRLYISQEFHEGKKVEFQYYDSDEKLNTMHGRTRLTPYFACKGKNRGKIIAAKATLLSGSERIHAGTNSINTAVTREVI